MIEQVLANCNEIDIVGIAKSGEEAIACIRQLRPDVVTLDLLLPGIDGFEVLESIMTSFPIPVIVISSAGIKGSLIHSKALDNGASAVFDKSKILREAAKLRSTVIHVKTRSPTLTWRTGLKAGGSYSHGTLASFDFDWPIRVDITPSDEMNHLVNHAG